MKVWEVVNFLAMLRMRIVIGMVSTVRDKIDKYCINLILNS